MVVGHVFEAPGTAHVVFRLGHTTSDKTSTSILPDLQIATVQLVDGEWKLVLDELSHAGIPGLRNWVWTREDPTRGGAVGR